MRWPACRCRLSATVYTPLGDRHVHAGRWHHIAVTWRSYDGQVKLYDNGREVRWGRGSHMIEGSWHLAGAPPAWLLRWGAAAASS